MVDESCSKDGYRDEYGGEDGTEDSFQRCSPEERLEERLVLAEEIRQISSLQLR